MTDSSSSPPGRVLARGREADILEAGPGRLLRRYRGRAVSDDEVVSMRWARRHGFPAPEVFDVEGGDMLLERLAGRTMLADLAARPWRVLAHADLLAALHRQLHAIPAPPDLHRQTPAGGDRLLHLDLHPENVLVGPHGPGVIDWSAARRGHPVIDIVNTWVVMETSEIPGNAVVRTLGAALRRTFIKRFLSHFDRGELLGELKLVASHRLDDPNVTAGERELVRRMLRTELSSTIRPGEERTG